MAEYEVPPRAVPENDAGYLEKITQAVFQSGFSWQVIRNKWPNFQQAFAHFDVATVARFTDEDLERAHISFSGQLVKMCRNIMNGARSRISRLNYGVFTQQ